MKSKGTKTDEGLLEYLESVILPKSLKNTDKKNLFALKQKLENLNSERLEQSSVVRRCVNELKIYEEGKKIAVDWVVTERKYFKLKT